MVVRRTRHHHVFRFRARVRGVALFWAEDQTSERADGMVESGVRYSIALKKGGGGHLEKSDGVWTREGEGSPLLFWDCILMKAF